MDAIFKPYKLKQDHLRSLYQSHQPIGEPIKYCGDEKFAMEPT
jgi:hypothetical protein